MAVSIIKMGEKTYQVNKHIIRLTRSGKPPAKHKLSFHEAECLQKFIKAEASGIRIQSSVTTL